MRKVLVSAFAALAALSLAACSGGEGEDSSKGSSPVSSSSSPTSSSSSPEETEDFSISTSSNGLSVVEESYSFATAAEGDLFPPEASFTMVTDSSWNLVTGLNERYTRVVAEDETVLPEDSVSLNIITNADIVGTSGSSEIEQIKVIFDRTLIQPGSTRLKVEVRPNNGSSTVTGKTCTICVDISVSAYGTMAVDTYSVDINLDLTGLADLIETSVPNLQSITWSTSADNYDSLYGVDADINKQVEIAADDTSATLHLDYVAGEPYSTWLFVESAEVKERMWISIVPSGSEDGYTLEAAEDGSESYLSVEEDGVVIEAELGDFHTLS